MIGMHCILSSLLVSFLTMSVIIDSQVSHSLAVATHGRSAQTSFDELQIQKLQPIPSHPNTHVADQLYVASALPSSVHTATTTVTPLPPVIPLPFNSLNPWNKHGLLRIRGVAYQPTPVGVNPLDANAPDLYSFQFHHLHMRDLRLLQALSVTAIRLYSFGGENANGESVDHTHFLNICWKHGIYVILTFHPSQGYPTGTWQMPIPPPLQYKKYNSTSSALNEWNRVGERFRAFVHRYQDHPAVLAWFIGNEPNLGMKGKENLPAYFRLMSRFAEIRDEECNNSKFNREYDRSQLMDADEVHSSYNTDIKDAKNSRDATQIPASSSFVPSSSGFASPFAPHPSYVNRTYSCWHPLTVPLSDTGMDGKQDLLRALLQLEAQYPHAVDMWAFQVYRGNTFSSFFDQFRLFHSKSLLKKPLLISEFGSDAFDFRLGDSGRSGEEQAVNQSMQAAAILKQQLELDACPSPMCVGGIVFEYVDEWWKASQYPNPSYMGCPLNHSESASIHAACGWAGKTDDEFYSEAYFGLVAYPTSGSSSNNNNHMECVEPRLVFYQLMDLWARNASRESQQAAKLALESMNTRRITNPPSSSLDMIVNTETFDLNSRLRGFCANESCCAYRDSSSWTSFVLFISTLCIIVGGWWIRLKLHNRKPKNAFNKSNVSRSSSAVTPPGFRTLASNRTALEQILTPHFFTAATIIRSTLFASATPSSINAHILLQLETLIGYLLDQLPRRSYSLSKSFIIVHEKLFAGYRCWCTFVGLEPNLNRCSNDSPRRHVPSSLTHMQPNAFRVQDVCEYLLIWSICEQLRRVPSFVHERFHYRYHTGEAMHASDQPSTLTNRDLNYISSDLTALSTRLTPSFLRSPIATTQKAIDAFHLDYDDLEDICLQPPLKVSASMHGLNLSKRIQLWFGKMWFPIRSPFVYSNSISILSLLMPFYSILTFQLLLFFLIFDVVSSAIIISLGNELSLRAFLLLFIEGEGEGETNSFAFTSTGSMIPSSVRISAAGLATLVQLAQIDVVLLFLFQLLSCLYTYSIPRIKHILLLVLSLKCMQVLDVHLPLISSAVYPMLSAINVPESFMVAGMFQSEERDFGSPMPVSSLNSMNSTSFALLYLTLRVTAVIWQTFWFIFRARTTSNPSHSVLPGRIDWKENASILRLLKDDSSHQSEDRIRIEKERCQYIEGFDRIDNQTHAIFLIQSASSAGNAVYPASGYKTPSYCKRVGMSCWYFLRLFMFWSLVFVVKVMFDTYVLIPSVVGIGVHSLCITPFDHGRNIGSPYIASTVPIRIKTREELVIEHVHNDSLAIGSSQSDEMQNAFLSQVACPSLVYILWMMTALMSLASTYVAYIVVVSVVGALVPSLFGSTRARNRIMLSVWMVLLWIGVMTSIFIGSFASWMAMLLIFACFFAAVELASGTKSRIAMSFHSHKLEAIRQELELTGKRISRLSTEAHNPSNCDPSLTSSRLPLLRGLNRSFQLLSHLSQSDTQTLAIWSMIVKCMREEDCISDEEASTSLTLPKSGTNTFFSSLHPISSPFVRERLHFFLESLKEIQRKSCLDETSESIPMHFPVSVQNQKSLTVLIPLYNETVFYSLKELIQPNLVTGLSLLEFLIAKFHDQWLHFIERICRLQPAINKLLRDYCHSSSLIAPENSSQIKFLGAAAVDLLLSASSHADSHSPLALLAEEVVLWCSYRGQTLSRTVRGLLYTQQVIELSARHEFNVEGESDNSRSSSNDLQRFVQSKFQLLVSAQIYGMRIAGRTNRRDLHKLMQMHAHVPYSSSSSSISANETSPADPPSAPLRSLQSVEIVYNFDARKDIEDCVQLRMKLIQSVSSTEASSYAEQLREPLSPFRFRSHDRLSLVTSSDTALLVQLNILLRRYSDFAVALTALNSALPETSKVVHSLALLQVPSPETDMIDQTSASANIPAVSSSSQLEPDEELLIQCEAQQCWIDTLYYLRHELQTMQGGCSLQHVNQLLVRVIILIDQCLLHDELLTNIECGPCHGQSERRHVQLGQLLQQIESVEVVSGKPIHVNQEESDPVVTVLVEFHSNICQQHIARLQSFVRFLMQLTKDPTASHNSKTRESEGVCMTETRSDNIDSSKRVSTSVANIIQALHDAFINLLVFGYYSVHCCWNSASTADDTTIAHSTIDSPSHSVHLIHYLPRHCDLILGSLSPMTGVPAPQTSAKSENQLHALVFARGEVIQTIDMNQDFTFENALKVPWALLEFQTHPVTDESRFSLIGCSEEIYTSNLSAIGRFMSLQDWSFVTIIQRVLAYTSSRLHYGHPDYFLAFPLKYSGIGLSKASPEKNLSEDLFYGFDSLLRGNQSSHIEYIRFGKGREVALSTTSIFENKLARGATQVLRTPDLYRLSHHLDALSFLSVMFGSVLHYLYTLLMDYSITTFVWILIFLRISGIDSERIGVLGSVYAIPWLMHLGYLFGLPLLFQLIYAEGFFFGTWKFLKNLPFGSIYYLFQLRTKATGIQSGFHAGSASYKGTGRSFGLVPDSLLTLYQQYARTHYHHAFQLILLLLMYMALLSDSREPVHVILLKCYAVLLACFSWIFAPILFNPTLTVDQHGDHISSLCHRWSQVLEQKKLELRQVWEWVHRPFEVISPGDSVPSSDRKVTGSWQQWLWEDRFHMIQLRCTRIFMYSNRGGRFNPGTIMQHPLSAAVCELVLRLVEWSPWLLFLTSLVISSYQYLPVFAVYFILCLVLFASPLSMHIRFLLICTAFLFYLTFIQMMESADQLMNRHRTNYMFLLTFTSIPPLFSLIIAAFGFQVFAADLLLHIAECRCSLHLSREYRRAREEPIAASGSSRSAADKASTAVPSYFSVSVNQRPILFEYVCNHPCFFAWQLVYRYACPMLLSFLHFTVAVFTHTFAELHSQICYDISLKEMISAAAQRGRRNQAPSNLWRTPIA